jgi:hypothetical protein
LETIQRDYADKGVEFYYIYKALAHPENNGYVAPFTLQERLMHVAEADKKLGTRFNWICDSMGNDLKHALGNAPNSEFVIDPRGVVVRARQWSNPSQLRGDLVELVGDVDRPTTVSEVGMKSLRPPKTAPRGIVERVKAPGGMSPVKVEPAAGLTLDSDPYYVKLRAEIDSQYGRGGQGTLYLGFFLDPLYEVHWNNQVAAIQYSVEAPKGVTVSPSTGKGPTVKEAADADPREFLLEVEGHSSKPLVITVKYFACDDAETFCKAVTQRYEVVLERDRDGGSRRAAGGRGGRGGLAGRPGGGRPGGGRPGGGRPERRGVSGGIPGGGFEGPPTPRVKADPERRQRVRKAASIFREHDKNRDGKLTAKEWPEFKNVEAGDDKQISLDELMTWLKSKQ